MALPPRSIPHFQPYPVAQVAAYDGAEDAPGEFPRFIELSVELTGFSKAELASTGMAQAYFDELGLIVGRGVRQGFLNSKLPSPKLLTDKKWGPVAQNLIRMWYLGRWNRLPSSWVAAANLGQKKAKEFDEFGRNVDHVISARAYQEGLAWRAAEINPRGAKQPGFASWTVKPK
jgi:hypothetical protein